MDQIRMCGVKKQHYTYTTIFTWCVLELVGPVQDLRDLISKCEAVNKATRQL
jgi:hypothetical protein